MSKTIQVTIVLELVVWILAFIFICVFPKPTITKGRYDQEFYEYNDTYDVRFPIVISYIVLPFIFQFIEWIIR